MARVRRGSRRGKLGVRSKFEDTIAADLTARRVRFEYESEVLEYTENVRTAECSHCGSNDVVQRRRYTPDFVVLKNNGAKLYLEAKGFFKSEDRSKMRAVKRCHPEIDLRMVFMRDGLIPGSKKQRYSDWCEKYGFIYHIGSEVPKSWLQS